MKKFIAAAVLPAGALLSLAAPAHAESATTTINSLKTQGFDVSITRVGNAPLQDCEVTNVSRPTRPPQLIPFDDDDINVFTVIPKPKVTVSLNCSM